MLPRSSAGANIEIPGTRLRVIEIPNNLKLPNIKCPRHTACWTNGRFGLRVLNIGYCLDSNMTDSENYSLTFFKFGISYRRCSPIKTMRDIHRWLCLCPALWYRANAVHTAALRAWGLLQRSCCSLTGCAALSHRRSRNEHPQLS